MGQGEQNPAWDFFAPASRMTDLRSGRQSDSASAMAFAHHLAARLVSAGIGPGCVAAIGHERAYDTILALGGVWLSGADALLVSPSLAPAEQANVAVFARVSHWLGKLGPGVTLAPPVRIPGAPPSLILMTSGTTGKPKGIRLSLDALKARVQLNIEAIGTADLTRTLCLLPAFFGHGLIGNCLTPLGAGGQLLLLDRPDVPETAGIGPLIDEQQISFLSSVPSFWKLAARMSPRPVSQTLRRIHVGSAPLSIEQWQAIARWAGTDNIVNMFGMTETANWISGGALADAAGRDGYVGKPWGGQFAVLAADGAVRDFGQGEVLVKTPSLMDHYTGDPAKTAETMLDGWLRTGDIGIIDAKGALTLTGRSKWEINRSGIKIQAEEIDMLLERHPAVLEACAFAIPDAVSGEAVAASVVLGGEASEQSIREWCRGQARPDAVPAAIFIVPALAKNERGKLDRMAVRAAALVNRP